MRVVLVEPSHWHFGMYRPGIVRSGARVLGVVDRNPQISARIARDFACPEWQQLEPMLDETRPDFAFAFGAHDRMPAIAAALAARGIPFSLEKPGGVHPAQLQALIENVRARGLYVSVPFHYRLSAMERQLTALAPRPSTGYRHFDFFINAGSPLRFADSSPWLVDPLVAGGGCMMNLAHHAIDFVAFCTGSAVEAARACISNAALGLEVEDAARLHLVMRNGATADIRTGYTHDSASGSYMGFEMSVSHEAFTAARAGDAMSVALPPASAARRVATDWQFKTFFADYAQDTLERCREGRPPLATLADLLLTTSTIAQAYAGADSTPGLGTLTRLHREQQETPA